MNNVETDNIIVSKSVEFAIRIINCNKYLISKDEKILSKQLLRSGTAVGALISEAEYAESKKDFIHKLQIALKEANETKYWLLLIYKYGLFTQEDYNSINKDCIELIKLLTSIINSSKGSIPQ